jgi:aspartyl-tRNA(Asn)/glutamyl-tRNA(Gln) amidotransferase subunit A
VNPYPTLAAAAAGLGRREVSSRELTEASFAVIEQEEPRLHAFLHLQRDVALAAADTADRKRAGGDAALVTGIPVAVKDNLATRGVPTTAGSKILAGYRPPYTATVVERLERANAVIVGKTNLDEFAMGSSTEYSAFGPTKNPRDVHRAPGGSSGGSAAAVAAGMVYGALGSDTGGSIRQPAALTGIVGIKPTYGRVSRRGLIALTSSTDCVGTFGKTVEDAAVLLAAVAGPDSKDATANPKSAPDFTAALGDSIRGLALGVPHEYFTEGMDPATKKLIESEIQRLERLGATLVPISLPHTELALAAYYVLTPAEASANLARLDGVRFGPGPEPKPKTYHAYVTAAREQGFGPEVKRRILLGTFALSSGYQDAYYGRAERLRSHITAEFLAALESVDAIVTPTVPGPAFKLGEVQDPVQMYLADVFCVASSLAGLPAVSVPAGTVADAKTGTELPVGLQIIGKPWDEATVLKVAGQYERAREPA